MALGTRRTPETDNPFLSSVVYEHRPGTAGVVSGVATTDMPMASLLAGFLPLDVQDAHTWTLPTAAAINAAIPGVHVGSSFDLEIINYGDSTLTLAVNTGVTTPTIAGVAAVMTVVTLASKRFRLCCTGVANPGDPSTSDSWTIYGFGSTAAAVA